MTEFKDVAHLYPKCELKTSTGKLTLECVRHDCIYGGEPDAYVMNGNQTHKMNWGDFKPILRPLSDIKADEATNLTFEQIEEIEDKPMEQIYFNVSQFCYLLKQGFDLFNLIENGFAIDKTTFK